MIVNYIQKYKKIKIILKIFNLFILNYILKFNLKKNNFK